MSLEAEDTPAETRLISRKQLRRKIPASDMTVWRWTTAGLFPKPLKINGRNYWRSDEIDRFIQGAQ